MKQKSDNIVTKIQKHMNVVIFLVKLIRLRGSGQDKAENKSLCLREQNQGK